MKKHPLAIAWDEWAESNPDSFVAGTLGTKAPNVYLKNRIHAAFNAGTAAQRHISLKALRTAEVHIETGCS